MRSLKALYTIPAHVSNVSDVRFFRADGLPPFKAKAKPEPADVVMDGINGDADADADQSHDAEDEVQEWKYRSGLYMASSGYDGYVKLWSADDWQLLRTLTTDSGKVMSVDMTSDGELLASGTYNRNFQLFAPEDVPV
jgi:U4/U6 small nuclear ribonucleoprotein PRP4